MAKAESQKPETAETRSYFNPQITPITQISKLILRKSVTPVDKNPAGGTDFEDENEHEEEKDSP